MTEKEFVQRAIKKLEEDRLNKQQDGYPYEILKEYNHGLKHLKKNPKVIEVIKFLQEQCWDVESAMAFLIEACIDDYTFNFEKHGVLLCGWST